LFGGAATDSIGLDADGVHCGAEVLVTTEMLLGSGEQVAL
jgi:hypothetical protein